MTLRINLSASAASIACYSTYLCLLSLFINTSINSFANSIPLRGNHPWTVLLCKFYDIPFEPHPSDYFLKWLNQDVEGSVGRYFSDISGGMYTIDGSTVHGWYRIPYTHSSVEALAEMDPVLSERYTPEQRLQKMYHKTKELCIQTAENSQFPLTSDVITIINDGSFAIFCNESGILLTPNYTMTSALTHEIVHSFHIGHSFSNRIIRVYPHAKIGEYDDRFDLMSTSNAYMEDSVFGKNGPGLIGPHLDYLGWLPARRILFLGSQGTRNGIYRLSCLGDRTSKFKNGLQLILVPFDRDDPQQFYTIEFRCQSPHNRGLKKHYVVIHKVLKKDNHLFSYLIIKNPAEYGWSFNDEYLTYLTPGQDYKMRIYVDYIHPSGGFAEITVQSTFSPRRCLQGEIAREAFSGDATCVTVEQASDVKKQNRLQSARFNVSSQRCMEPYAIRNATANDSVCVTKDQRLAIKVQNLRWKKYVRFFKQRTYGLNACQDDYVWRLIDEFDFVCVPAATRSSILKQATWHRLRSNSTGDCKSGFIPRESFPHDHVCVTKAERLESKFNTQMNFQRLKYPKFFNGVDEI